MLRSYDLHSFMTEDFFVINNDFFVFDFLADNKWLHSVTINFHEKYKSNYEIGLSILKSEIRKDLTDMNEKQIRKKIKVTEKSDITDIIDEPLPLISQKEEIFVRDSKTENNINYKLPKFTSYNTKVKKDEINHIQPVKPKTKKSNFDLFK